MKWKLRVFHKGKVVLVQVLKNMSIFQAEACGCEIFNAIGVADDFTLTKVK